MSNDGLDSTARAGEQIASHVPPPMTEEPGQPGTVVPPAPRANQVLREIFSGSWVISIFAVVLAMLIGSILIAATDEDVQAALAYFFARPGDTFAAIWDSVSGAYSALFQGSIYNFRRPDFADGIKPLTETLTFATPLIMAGLGVALAFRVGLFNIGGRGQMLIAAAAAGYVGFAWPLPCGIHMIVALAAGLIAGGIWGGIVGLLKARTGAHEVIVTIMLNYVAFYLISWMLRTPGLLQAPGSDQPEDAGDAGRQRCSPTCSGPQYNLHFGFILVIVATVAGVVHHQPVEPRLQVPRRRREPERGAGRGHQRQRDLHLGDADRGALVGLAGVTQVLGTVTTGFTAGIDAGIGFDAITVALLGRSRRWACSLAGILFGAFKAGGFSMQAAQGIPIEIVLVVQSLIVLFIAAPPLVRTIFFLPNARPGPGSRQTSEGQRQEGGGAK